MLAFMVPRLVIVTAQEPGLQQSAWLVCLTALLILMLMLSGRRLFLAKLSAELATMDILVRLRDSVKALACGPLTCCHSAKVSLLPVLIPIF